MNCTWNSILLKMEDHHIIKSILGPGLPVAIANLKASALEYLNRSYRRTRVYIYIASAIYYKELFSATYTLPRWFVLEAKS
jgi:hypothetical protein